MSCCREENLQAQSYVAALRTLHPLSPRHTSLFCHGPQCPEASTMLPSRAWWHIHKSGTSHAYARLTQRSQLKHGVSKQPLPLYTGVQQSVPHLHPLSHLHTDTQVLPICHTYTHRTTVHRVGSCCHTNCSTAINTSCPGKGRISPQTSTVLTSPAATPSSTRG